MKPIVNEERQSYLSFRVKDCIYGFLLNRVAEIISELPLVRVPHSRRYVDGMVNLRGQIFPVISMRTLFHISGASPTRRCIIVYERRKVDGRSTLIGFLVDEVCDVLSLYPKQIEKRPDLSHHVDEGAIEGMVNLGDQSLILVNMDIFLNNWNEELEEHADNR